MEENTKAQTPSDPQSGKKNTDINVFIKKNKTPLLIIGLTVLTVILVMVALAPKNGLTPPPPIQKTLVSPADTTVAMSQSTATPGNAVDINVNSGKNKINAVQFELSYDPSVITNVSIVKGPFMDKAFEIYKKIDTANGRISIALASPIGGAAYTGSGVAAVISYTPLSTTKPVVIKFLPKTVVTSLGFSQSAIKNISDFTSTPVAK